MAGSASEGDDEIVGINVTPLVDIVLVLLIIFMVTANMIVRETVEVDLPTGATGRETPKAPLMVTLDKDGKVFLDGLEVPQPLLVPKMKETAANDKEARAVISADPSLNYANVVQLIDLVKEAGIAKFALNLQKDKQAEVSPSPSPPVP
jgi:biopolymer transport protein ExbD